MSTNYYLENLKTGEKAHIGLWSASRFTFHAPRRGCAFFPASAADWAKKIQSKHHRIVDEYGRTVPADEFFEMIGYVPGNAAPAARRPADDSRVRGDYQQFFDTAGFRFLACEFG